MEETNGVKVKKPRKKYPRATTVRFDTEEAKLILMAMNYAKNRDLFVNEGESAVRVAYAVMAKLKHRIDAEREKKGYVNQVSVPEVRE